MTQVSKNLMGFTKARNAYINARLGPDPMQTTGRNLLDNPLEADDPVYEKARLWQKDFDRLAAEFKGTLSAEKQAEWDWLHNSDQERLNKQFKIGKMVTLSFIGAVGAGAALAASGVVAGASGAAAAAPAELGASGAVVGEAGSIAGAGGFEFSATAGEMLTTTGGEFLADSAAAAAIDAAGSGATAGLGAAATGGVSLGGVGAALGGSGLSLLDQATSLVKSGASSLVEGFGKMSASQIASLGASAISAITTAKAANDVAKAGKKAAETNALSAEANARTVIEEGGREAIITNQRADQLIGRQRAGYAGSGVDLNYGTAAQVQDETRFFAAQDTATTRKNARSKADAYTEQAKNFREQGSTYNPTAAIAGSLIGSGSQIADKWMRYQGN